MTLHGMVQEVLSSIIYICILLHASVKKRRVPTVLAKVLHTQLLKLAISNV